MPTERGELQLNRSRIEEIAEETYKTGLTFSDEDEREFEDDFESSKEPVTAAALPAEPEPVATPAPANITPEPTVDPILTELQESRNMNRELMALLQKGLPSPQPRPVEQPRQQEPQPEPWQMVTYQDLSPLQQELNQVRVLTTFITKGIEQQVEQEARQAHKELRDQYKDADELVPPQLIEQALSNAKRQALEAAKQGQPFSYNFRKSLKDHYDMMDAPRMREREQKRLEQEAIAAKQKEELAKVSGVPAQGAVHQGNPTPRASQRRDRKPGEGWGELRSNVAAIVNRMSANA